MGQIFITNLSIKKVRHLKDITIPLSENQMKHLIFTGKNGSGKTSVVEAMSVYLDNAFKDEYFTNKKESVQGLAIQFNQSMNDIYLLKYKCQYILAYYRANRIFKAVQPKHVEKVQLKDYYGLFEYPRDEFVKYLLDLKKKIGKN